MIEFKRPTQSPAIECIEFVLEPGHTLIDEFRSPTGIKLLVENPNGDLDHWFYDFSDRSKGWQKLG